MGVDPADIIRTPGTESNVKEIYDKCAELERDKDNVILNQFSEFANYLIHYHRTGAAFDRVFSHLKSANATIGWRPSCRRPDRPGRSQLATSEIPARHEDRSGGSHRMPDDAVQWIR